MRTLKLGGLAKDWRSVEYRDLKQYMRDSLDIKVRERKANRMARMIKQAGFRVIKTLDEFIWKPGIEVPGSITREKVHPAPHQALCRRSSSLNRISSAGAISPKPHPVVAWSGFGYSK